MLRGEPARRPRTRPRRHEASLLDHAVLLLALAVLVGGFSPVLDGPWWWTTTVVVMACVLVTTGVLRAFSVRLAPVAGLALASFVVLWAFVPGTLALGVVPTPSTVREISALLDRAGTIIAAEPPPVEAVEPIAIVLVGGFGLVALVAVLLLGRRGGVLLIGGIMAGAYLVPAAITEDVPSFAVLTVAGGLWLVLLHRSVRVPVDDRQQGAQSPVSTIAVAFGLAAVVAAFALAPVLPDTTPLTGVADAEASGPFDRGINPMLTLGDDLRRGGNTTALEYTTSGGPVYLSVAMLTDFTGDTFEPVEDDSGLPDEGRVDIGEEVRVSRESVDVRIRSLRASVLPVPYPSVDVDRLLGPWEMLAGGRTYFSETSDTRDQSYSVRYLERRPTAAQLAEASEDDLPSSLDPYLELPAALPSVVSDTAEQVTAGAVGAYAKAQALQDFFRSGAFEYSETAPVDGDYDGTGIEVLERFLAERSGYCVHYASAMAAMARSLGIPARIMVGYAPGQLMRPGPDDDGDQERYRVMSNDLHAWPQIYVDGVGWMEFEPTPGISDGTPASGPDAAPTEPAPEVTTAAPEPTASVPAPEREENLSDVAAPQQTETSNRLGWLALPVLLVLAAPALARVALRRRRLRASAMLDDRWREVVSTAIDLGIPVDATTTVRDHAVTLFDHVGKDTMAAVERLCLAVEESRYGPRIRTAVVDDLRADASTVVASLLATAPPGRRRRARLLPRSLYR
ncbi:DUF3488 and transglutaminase-like domain-containing protein [Aeromicrobium alkaliterrae]|uniref:DUF3488 and transglutaminase-like domain-containing protein n=1 Tax=Aeromicrobium alkaliterrae TaxID=302168 RepID=A0ABP4VH78_9ACTN